jgi:hypothetical protein
MDGVKLIRTLLVRSKTALPLDLRTYYHPFIYGPLGRLLAVAFQMGIQLLFQWLNWICGITVFLGIGVFGLGYDDLGEMLLG